MVAMLENQLLAGHVQLQHAQVEVIGKRVRMGQVLELVALIVENYCQLEANKSLTVHC